MSDFYAWAFIFAQILLIVGLWVLVNYLRGLPERLHEEGVKQFEFTLNEKLEGVRAALARDIELLKISQTELQSHKNAEVLRLAEFFAQAMTDPKFLKGIDQNPKSQQQMKNNMFDLGMKLFFFASDETVRAFNDWRGAAAVMTQRSGPESLLGYARLMLMIRKDVGHGNTSLTEEDYLRSTIVDWDQYKDRVGLGSPD